MDEQLSFAWDLHKETLNVFKHGIDFRTAVKAFKDPLRKIAIDTKHSHNEQRYYCIGKVNNKILTVRFTYRDEKIRIIGAGYWRKGAKEYGQNT